MDVVYGKPTHERAERQWRITAAFFESALATSAALEGLLGRLYRRDPDSLAHLHRVATLSIRIGEELGFNERTLDDLERAALMHDIGRLVLPDVRQAGNRRHRPSSPLRASAGRVRADEGPSLPAIRGHIVGASLEFFDGSGRPVGRAGRRFPWARESSPSPTRSTH